MCVLVCLPWLEMDKVRVWLNRRRRCVCGPGVELRGGGRGAGVFAVYELHSHTVRAD